jgi:WD40 repeat protein
MRFYQVIHKCAFQVYRTALLFTPPCALRVHYQVQIDHSIRMQAPFLKSWSGLLSSWKTNSGSVSSVATSVSGAVFSTGSSDNIVRIWDTMSGAIICILEGHTAPVTSVDLTAMGNLVASASMDTSVRLWNTTTGLCTAVLSGHSKWAMSAAFSSTAEIIVSASHDHLVKIWDVHKGKVLRTLRGHSLGVNSAFLSPNDALIVSSSHDKTLRIWQTSTGDCLIVLEGHDGAVRSAVFSPSGFLVASTGDDGSIRIWDARALPGRLVDVLRHSDGRGSRGNAIQFLADEKELLCGSDDGIIRLWSLKSRRVLIQIKASTASVHAVALSNEDSGLVFGSSNGCVSLWDLSYLRHHNTATEMHGVNLVPVGLKLADVGGSPINLLENAVWSDRPLDPRRILNRIQSEKGPQHLQIDQEFWVCDQRTGKRLCWLPPDYRPDVITSPGLIQAVSGRTYACIIRSGALMTLEFLDQTMYY